MLNRCGESVRSASGEQGSTEQTDDGDEETESGTGFRRRFSASVAGFRRRGRFLAGGLALGGRVAVRRHVRLVAGLVGRGPAAELLAFFDVATDDMQLDRIFESPSSCPVPTEPSRMFATVTALLRTVDDKNAMPVTRYVRRLPIEYQMKFLTDLTLANAYLIVRTPALMDFQLTLIDETREAA